MNCFVHDRSPAVGICAVCQKAVCRQCVGLDTPRIVCRACLGRQTVLGFEYRSRTSIGGVPLIHVCAGIDPRTMRPKIAKGVVAIGNIAVGAAPPSATCMPLAEALSARRSSTADAAIRRRSSLCDAGSAPPDSHRVADE